MAHSRLSDSTRRAASGNHSQVIQLSYADDRYVVELFVGGTHVASTVVDTLHNVIRHASALRTEIAR